MAGIGPGKNVGKLWICIGQTEQKLCKNDVIAVVAPEIFRQGAGASDRGAKMTEKLSFRATFCKISSDETSKFPPTGGLDASDKGAVAPSSPPLAPPLRHRAI